MRSDRLPIGGYASHPHDRFVLPGSNCPCRRSASPRPVFSASPWRAAWPTVWLSRFSFVVVELKQWSYATRYEDSDTLVDVEHAAGPRLHPGIQVGDYCGGSEAYEKWVLNL